MSEDSKPRRSGLFRSLSGDETGKLDLLLTRDAARSLETRLADVDMSDDYVFQSHLRFLSALYHFLGGSKFDTILAEALIQRPSAINRWLSGLSAPPQNVRVAALAAAEKAVRHLELKRRLGASLHDITSKGED